MNLHARYTGRFLVCLLSASFLIAPAASNGAELKEETLNAWGAYIQHANAEMDDRLSGRFLWVDEEPRPQIRLLVKVNTDKDFGLSARTRLRRKRR